MFIVSCNFCTINLHLQVPPNNKPVQDEAPDLLNLENELESMERVRDQKLILKQLGTA